MRLALKVALGLAAVVVGGTAAWGAHDGQPDAEPSGPLLYHFVAMPDFLNQDVGDVRTLPTWRPGDPNSWTPYLERSIEVVLDEVEDVDPDSVLVGGDLVEGHWLSDVDHTGIFGPSRTDRQRTAMLRRAGRFYHSTYAARFRERGLELHAAVGDHDVGDNPFRGPKWRFKRASIPVYKQLFGDAYTRTADGAPRYAERPVGTPWADTAYAAQLSPDVLLVTVDVFHVTRNDVRIEVVGGQLAWLRDTLRAAQEQGTRWVVVQGHTPIVTPVRTRMSSALTQRGGTDSALWRTLDGYDVDLYLAGEVHDTSMQQEDGVTQVATGGLLYAGDATYLTADVYDDRVVLDVREFDSIRHAWQGDLWQLGAYRTFGHVEIEPGSHSVGQLVLLDDGSVLSASGKLADYGG